MKIAVRKYLFLDFLFAFFVVCGYDLNFSLWLIDENSETFCSTADVFNYMNFTYNYFHWFRSDENLACRFTSFDTWAFFIPILIFYTVLKSYGNERWHKSVTWQIIIPEICIYLFIYLAFLFNQSGFIMTIGSFLNATLGAIMFGLPLIIYAIFIALANSRYISKNKSFKGI